MLTSGIALIGSLVLLGADSPQRLGTPDPDGNYGDRLSVTFSPDGKSVATVDSGIISGTPGEMRIWDRRTGRLVVRLLQPKDVGYLHCMPIAFTRDGKSLIACAADMDGNLVGIWDIPGGKLRKKLSWKGHWIGSFAVSPDGRTLAIDTFERKGNAQFFRIYDLAAGKELRRIKWSRSWPSHPAFSPDGSVLASPNGDEGVLLWNVATGKEVRRLTIDDRFTLFHSVAFSPDGALLVSGTVCPDGGSRNSDDANVAEYKAVRLWDVASGKVRLVMRGHEDGVDSVAYSPDGMTVCSASRDGTIRVWEVISGKEIFRFQGKDNKPYHIAYSPDGKLLASAMSDGTALLWKLTPEPLRSPAEAWDKLAESDAKEAYRAVYTLAASPDSVWFLKGRLKAVPKAAPKHIRELIDRLGNADFSLRETATGELYWLGPQVQADLRQAAEAGSGEVRRRAKGILKRLEEWRIDDPETLRAWRAIWVLERIATPEARELLAQLAKGAPDARLTQEARMALDRLNRGWKP